MRAEHTSEGLGRAADAIVSTSHPVVAARPVTGEPVLYVNPLWTRRIEGLTPDESHALLTLLFDVALGAPELAFRHHWQPGDVVVWDMRSTLHRAVDDYGTAARVLRRASVLHGPPEPFER
jgi:taurine dioxygenase